MIETVLFFLTSIFLSLGQIGRISFLNQQINFYLYEISAAILLLIMVFKYRFDPVKLSISHFPYTYIFFIWLLFSYIIGIGQYTFYENIVGLLYFLRLVFYSLFFIYIGFHIKNQKAARRIIKKSLILFIVLTVISSLIQYFFYPQLRNLIYLGWDEHLYRMFGTFLDTAVASGVYGLIFIYIYLNKGLFVKKKIFRYIFLVLLSVCILLTYSRTLYLSMGMLVAYFLIRNKNIKKLIFITGLFLLLLMIIPKPIGEGVNLVRKTSIIARVTDYNTGFRVWLKSPITGIGYNRIRYVKGRLGLLTVDDFGLNHAASSFHSTFLIILATGGLVGLFLFILSLWQICGRQKKMAVYIIFLSILSLSDNILFHPFILYLLILIGNS